MKHSKTKYFAAAGIAGIVTFGSLNISAQDQKKDIPVPKDVAAAPADAAKTKSGLASKVLKKGTGKVHPGARDTVEVHYSGWDKTGKMFDSSVARGEPISFPLDQVIKGWTEGVQLMVEGEKRRLWIPAAMAYGEVPARPGAPAGDLCFDVELISIKKAPELPKVPEDVAAAPADALKTKSGLASKVLKKGTGTEHPGGADTVEVHYSGWDKKGKMFDSSVARGEPISFALDRVIKGWTEGVQLMVVGEKRRLWIPAAMAYGEEPKSPGAPSGDLCFDIELLSIKKAPKMPKVPKNLDAAPADAIKTQSGLASKVLKQGTGKEHPGEVDFVTVHYSGWDKSGNMFDSSVMRGEPSSFSLNQVIKGWTEGVQLMVAGEKRRFWIPAALAYGEVPSRPGAPAGDLIFDVELISMKKAPKMPETPKNVANPPANAVDLGEGVKSIVTKAGKGNKPKDDDVALVNYTGWAKNGEVIDSSVPSGDTVPLPLSKIPSALKSAILQMQIGEVRQVWIPSKHIVGEKPQPGAPVGPFCYQFELVEIVNTKK